MPGRLQVEIEQSPGEAWDAYVRSHPTATANHLSAWAWILKTAYRFKPIYLSLRDSGGEVHGVLPLVHRHGPISGSRLNSLPAVRWAGPLAGTPDQEARLMQAACELVRDGKA